MAETTLPIPSGDCHSTTTVVPKGAMLAVCPAPPTLASSGLLQQDPFPWIRFPGFPAGVGIMIHHSAGQMLNHTE